MVAPESGTLSVIFGEFSEAFGEALDVIGIGIDGSNSHIAKQHVLGHAFNGCNGDLAKRVWHCHGTFTETREVKRAKEFWREFPA